jgi:ribonuclease BN (tRNA processing enzyme)
MSRYGGNTSCVEVCLDDPTHVVILDAGTGICVLGSELSPEVRRVDMLLTHLHMDHIVGLGFFDGLYRPGLDVHLWGPSSAILGLRSRLGRYLSPPLFPVTIRELPCELTLHDTPLGTFEIPGLRVQAALVCHPGPTVGYRIDDGGAALAYLPDHEPALGVRRFPDLPRWTSGYDLAADVDVLIHDAQYDDDEYRDRVGWGHSTLGDAVRFAEHAGVGLLVPFHHDPRHDDAMLDAWFTDPPCGSPLGRSLRPAREGDVFEVASSSSVTS